MLKWDTQNGIRSCDPRFPFSGSHLSAPVIAVNVPPHLDPTQRHLWGVPPSPHHLFGYSVPNSYGYNQFVPTTVDPTSFAHPAVVVHQHPVVETGKADLSVYATRFKSAQGFGC